MGSQRVKEEKETKEKPKESPKEKPVAGAAKERAVKKWKGKDWFTVIAPKMFDEKELGEIPATDPQHVMGRNIEASLAELSGNPSKYRVKLRFKVHSVDGNRALTRFNGLNLVKEQVFRVVRKRTSKVEIVHGFETKDKWLLHFKVFAVLNRSTDTEIQKKVRSKAVDFLKNFASKATVDDVVKTVCDGLVQKNIKKFGSSIYPIRFCEVIKIDVKKVGK